MQAVYPAPRFSQSPWSALFNQSAGDDRFREQIEKKYGIKVGQMKRGRPRKVVGKLVNI